MHAARDIECGETILYVPGSRLMIVDKALLTPIGSQIIQKGIYQHLDQMDHSYTRSIRHIFLAIYML